MRTGVVSKTMAAGFRSGVPRENGFRDATAPKVLNPGQTSVAEHLSA